MDIILHNIIILNRSSAPHTALGGLTIKKIMRSFEWRINMDAIGSVTSTFRVVENIRNESDIVTGDIVIVTPSQGMFGDGMLNVPQAPPGGQHFTGLYFGVIDTYTDNTIVCRDISALFNVTHLMRSSDNTEAGRPELYITNRMNEIRQVTGSQLGFITFRFGAIRSEPWSITFDRPTIQNLSQVISNAFTYNQIIATPHYFTFTHAANPPRVNIELFVRHEGDEYPLPLNLDDASKFHEVDVFVQDRNVGSPNLLQVWDDDGGVHPSWARLTNGNVVSFPRGNPPANVLNNLDIPVVIGAVSARIDNDNPFNEARARETLTGNEYRHTVTFQYNIQDEMGGKLLRIGQFVNLTYDNQPPFRSIITGWSISSDNNLATITCGNIRSSLQSFIGY